MGSSCIQAIKSQLDRRDKMAFGSIVFTTRGKVLQSKAQAGTKLNFTKLAIGDGELGSQSVLELTDLKNKKLDIPISALKVLTGGIASVGGTFTNENIDIGFYWREVGLYATDPDIGEILYVYGNAGALAEYIPSSGGSEILEKFVAIEAIIGNANNVSATINQSLVYATIEDIETHNSDPKAHPELSQQIKNLSSPYVIPEGTDIPVQERVKGKMYFKVTSRQSSGGTIESVRVSPNMGIKVQE